MPSPTPELRNEIVRAGAGAGKTTELTRRVLAFADHWMKSNSTPPRVVVTTFTRKATEELNERLLKESMGNKALLNFVSEASYLHVSTIHGVLSNFLRRYGHLLDIDTGFTVLDGAASAKRQRRILRRVLIGDPELLKLLEYFTIIDLVGMFGERADWPHACTVVTVNEIFQTRTLIFQKQVAKLNRLVEAIQAECSNEKWAPALTTLKSNLLAIKVDENLEGAKLASIADEIEWPRFMKKSPPFSEELNLELDEVLEAFEKFQRPRYQSENFESFVQVTELFENAYFKYENELDSEIRDTGVFDMRDLERYAWRAIREKPELAQAFSADVDFWLIDEFQDTSPVQVEILKSLMGQKFGFFVGDPQQSIYLFRGARSEVFNEKEVEVVRSGGIASSLEVNYRSRPALVEFFNDLFATYKQPFMKMKSRPVKPDDTKSVVTVLQADKNDNEPYRLLADEIIRRVGQGERFDDFCVLARRNSELVEVSKCFETCGISVHVHSGGSFFDRREILDLVSLLKFLVNPYDHKNLVRLLRSPWFHLADEDLIAVTQTSPLNLFGSLLEKYQNNKALTKLREHQMRAKAIGVYEAFREAVLQSAMIELASYHDATGRREANIWKFLTLLKEKEKTPGFSYLQFIQDILDRKNDEYDAESDAIAALEPNCVNFMTVHKSKGLKFQNVVLVNLESQLKTSKSREHERKLVINEKKNQIMVGYRLENKVTGETKLEHCLTAQQVIEDLSEHESREFERLFYVALTRAARSVLLHWQGQCENTSWGSKIEALMNAKPQNPAYEIRKISANDSASKKPETLTATGRGTAEKSTTLARQRYVDISKTQFTKISVTKLLEINAESAGPSTSSLSREGDERIDQKALILPVLGQKIHTLFERMKYSDSFNSADYMRRWFKQADKEMIRAIDNVLNLGTPPVRKIIECGEVEWGFQLKSGPYCIEGQIDLWGTVDGVTWLIDYKSGTSKYQGKAFDQLDLYSLALRAIGVTGPIKSAVIFVLEEKVAVREVGDAAKIREKFKI